MYKNRTIRSSFVISLPIDKVSRQIYKTKSDYLLIAAFNSIIKTY